MRGVPAFLLTALSIVVSGCGGSPPSTPLAPTPVAPVHQTAGAVVSVLVVGTPPARGASSQFTAIAACGFTVAAGTQNWTVSTSYGRPAPFVQFISSGGTTTLGEVLVTAGGTKFKFASVDVYSSTTPIPYAITGIANSAAVFSVLGTQGNTFGNFATVLNPHATTPIDALVIRLSNFAAPCCTNPMGLDNIVLVY